MSSPARFLFGEFEIDCARFELRRNGRLVRLERLPMELLILLAEKDGNVVNRQEIVERLWGKDVFVDSEHGVNTAIGKIRIALRENAGRPRFIQTVPGKGYRFAAEKNGFTKPVEAAPPQGVSETEAAPSAMIPSANVPAPQISARRFVAMTAVALFVTMAMLAALNVGGIRERILQRNHQAGSIRSIAVLPLANLSGDPSQDYYADGMTVELITALAENRSLRVVSRTSTLQYKGAGRPLPQVAQALGVDGILEGSVNRSADHVHMSLQLIYAPTDTNVWARSYDRDLNSAMSLPQELAQTIAAAARVGATPAKPQRYVNPEAHDDYLLGRYFWFRGNNVRSGEYFEKALRLQPDYALAWDGLADLYEVKAGGTMPPQEASVKSEAAARKAVELDDSFPEAHNTLAMQYLFSEWDWRRAEAESQRTVALEPGFANGHHMRSYVLLATNRDNEALEEEKHANEIDPFEKPWALGRLYILLRQYDAAINDLRLREDADPKEPWLPRYLAKAYWLKGMWAESEQELEKAHRLDGDEAMASAEHRAFGRGGEKAVEQLGVDVIRARARTQYVSPYDIAERYSYLGDKEQAMNFLEAAYRERAPWLVMLQKEPIFDFLHSEPRYRALVARIGLPSVH
jgi:TolB-like protein/DNA-binding winged helix-turn-helix (wHTH) protein